MTVILCQIDSLDSLLQKKDHFNKTTITFKELIVVCMPFTSLCLKNRNVFPRIEKVCKIFY